MKIAMIGQKRTDSREGGVEVVVSQLSKRMAQKGHEVICYDRSGNNVATDEKSSNKDHYFEGVRIRPVKTFDKKGLAALSSSFFGTFSAIKEKPDIIHYHAEGPSVPLIIAKMAGIRTVVTIHGLDWKRAKWGKLSSFYLKLGEKISAKNADEIIVLSENLKDYFKNEYNRQTTFIPNGVDIVSNKPPKQIKKRWGLDEGNYVLYLGRLVPEKGIHYLLEAFKNISTEKKLVIAGGGSDSLNYEKEIISKAKEDPRVIVAGFVEGDILNELFSNAYVYILPSEIEGMPMSLLEAMAHGCCCITSDIPECVSVLNNSGIVFETANVESLQECLEFALNHQDICKELGDQAKDLVIKDYDWDAITVKTLALYGEKDE